jgi:hypothetical protein
MRSSFLSLMRGPDGRRLGLVLAVVLFVSGLVGAIGTGAAVAMTGDGFAICTTDGASGGAPAHHPADHAIDCCLLGHAPAQAAAAPAAIEIGAIAMRQGALPIPAADTDPIVRRFLGSDGPRGPPLAA